MQNKIESRDPKFLEQNFKDGRGFVTVGDGIYKFYTALNNSSVVDMSLIADVYRVHNVILRRDNNSSESTWRVVRRTMSPPLYEIRSGKDNSLLLGVGDIVSYGENVIAKNDNPESEPFIWYFLDAGNGLVYIVNILSLSMMDVEGASTSDGTNIFVSPPYHGDQMFRLEKLRNL